MIVYFNPVKANPAVIASVNVISVRKACSVLTNGLESILKPLSYGFKIVLIVVLDSLASYLFLFFSQVNPFLFMQF